MRSKIIGAVLAVGLIQVSSTASAQTIDDRVAAVGVEIMALHSTVADEVVDLQQQIEDLTAKLDERTALRAQLKATMDALEITLPPVPEAPAEPPSDV